MEEMSLVRRISAKRPHFNMGALLLSVVVCTGIVMRFAYLGHVPGINADECWYGIQAGRLLQGAEVSWAGPSGRPLINPYLFPSQLGFMIVDGARFLWLRAPVAVASVAALLVAAIPLSKVVPRTAAWVLAALLATLPIDIAYARLGWDPSLIGVCSVLMWSLALRNRLAASVLIILLGCLSHPGFLLAIPPIALAYMPKVVAPGIFRRILMALCVGTLMIVCAAWVRASALGNDAPVNAQTAVNYVAGWPEVLSGETMFAWIVDDANAVIGSRTALLCGVVLLTVLLLGSLWMLGRAELMVSGFVAGTLAGYAGLFAVVGDVAVTPSTERFGVVLVYPILMSVALLLASSPAWLRRGSLVLVAAMVTANGYRVWTRYFVALIQHGSRSHPAFMTAGVDPRQQAYEMVARAATGQKLTVIVDGWWIAKPIEYLAVKNHQIVVNDLRELLPSTNGHIPFHNRMAFIAYPKSDLSRFIAQNRLPLQRNVVVDYGERPVLEVFVPKAESADAQ